MAVCDRATTDGSNEHRRRAISAISGRPLATNHLRNAMLVHQPLQVVEGFAYGRRPRRPEGLGDVGLAQRVGGACR